MLVLESNKAGLIKRKDSILFQVIAIYGFVLTWDLEVNSLNTGNEGSLTQDINPRRGSHFLKKKQKKKQIFSNNQPKKLFSF